MAGWATPEHPEARDLAACVGCGLCLPHCPTFRLSAEEAASPRGRLEAMRAVAAGRMGTPGVFADTIDACLGCRSCETACPSGVPFGRILDGARAEVEATRSAPSRRVRGWLLGRAVANRRLVATATATALVAQRLRLGPLLPAAGRRLLASLPPLGPEGLRPLPELVPAQAGTVHRGRVGLLAGCVGDLWFRDVNLAALACLTAAGYDVVVPRRPFCCGALALHNGHPGEARRLARRLAAAFRDVDVVVSTAAGCTATLVGYESLIGRSIPAADVCDLLADPGVPLPEPRGARLTVAVHDACHHRNAGSRSVDVRVLLGRLAGLTLVDVGEGSGCCGAAGTYGVLHPEAAGRLGRERAAAVVATGADVVAVANPGCAMQIGAHLRALGSGIDVAHPVQLAAGR